MGVGPSRPGHCQAFRFSYPSSQASAACKWFFGLMRYFTPDGYCSGLFSGTGLRSRHNPVPIYYTGIRAPVQAGSRLFGPGGRGNQAAMTVLIKYQVAGIVSKASFKSTVAFNLADAHHESTIPLLITHFLGEPVFGMLMPVFDVVQAGPIRDSDAQSTAHIFHSRKTGLQGGQIFHFFRLGSVSIITISPQRCEYDSKIGWSRCKGYSGHLIFLVRKSIKSLLFQRPDQTCEIRSLGKSDCKGCKV
jgi:hypothetical protein